MKIDDHNNQLNNITITGEDIYSSEDQIYDYLSIQGLNTRFGLDGKDFDIFIIKELIDNALDIIEQNAKEFVNKKSPIVDVIITSEEVKGKELTKIIIRNSNAGINNIFSKEQIDNIFKLDKYYSSKRYRHKINRGELGDAFKAILCIPYAIAINNNSESNNNNKYQNWNYPLEINITSNDNNNKSIKIWIGNIDKIRRKERVEVKKEYNSNNNKPILQDKEETNNYNQFTEIVVYLPEISVDYIKIYKLLQKYIVFNTHINFSIQLPRETKVGKPSHYYYVATQELSDWKNKPSIYYYSLPEFKDLIHSLEKSKDNLNIYDNFIHTTFREGWRLKRDEVFKTLTYGELKKDDKKIEETYQKLKDSLPPIKDQSSSLVDLELPFDMNKKTREKALEERLKQIYLIEEGSFIYKRFDRYSESPNSSNNNGNVQFPYMVEIGIAKSPIFDQKRLTLIESLNCSPSLHSSTLFHANESIFTWEKKNGEPWKTNDIVQILEDCGYSIDDEKLHKKDNNLIFINLITPRIDYRSHSKSNIELKPFAPTMGQDIYNFCKNASSSSRNKNSSSYTENSDNTYQLELLLEKRLDDVRKNPKLLMTGRLLQNGIFYTLRKILIEKGIKVASREHITGSITDVCARLGKKVRGVGFKRHELGIIAAARAQLYFEGQSIGVGIDEISDLAQVGTDLIIIEKEGAVEALTPFADKYGIALVYTRGFLTEYAIELSELAEKSGCNVAILTDFDASGLLIATKLRGKNIQRIGITPKMVNELGLDIKSVQEEYTPQKGHYDTLAEWVKKNNYNLISKYWLNYAAKNRIEIDSVLGLVENEEFWDYVIKELTEIFPIRNYNRAIDVQKSVMPKKLEEFIANISDKIGEVQAKEQQKIIKELENVKGFFKEDVDSKKEEIEERLRAVVEDNPEVKKIMAIIEELKKKYFNE